MALWEAPITATEIGVCEGMILARTGGLRAGSSPISWALVNGRGPDVGDEPVQRTRRSEVTVVGPENFSSSEEMLTVQFFDY